MASEIKLTRGLVAIVDDEDYERISAFKWYAIQNRRTGKIYAARSRRMGRIDGKRVKVCILMHREVLGVGPSDKVEVDHVEAEQTLDNRRTNLRQATRTQNSCNRPKQRNNTSGFKGVYLDKRRLTWSAKIQVAHRVIHLGTFSTPELAHEAYQKAVPQFHGEFGRAA